MNRIIVGITGASGVVYGLRLLEALRDQADVEVHLVVSPTAKEIFRDEVDATAFDRAQTLAHRCHDISDLSACIASGSFQTAGMIIAPCSVKTLAAVAHGFGDNLLTRAADVVLKEQRRLVLMVRETPLHLAHLENMAQVARMGGVVLPPIPAFYHKPRTIDDIVRHTVGKALDLFGLPHNLYRRWEGR